MVHLRLQINRTLEHLELEKNELGEDGGFSVARAIASNVSITFLSMAQNDLGVAGGAFAGALKLSASLQSLNLSKNGLGPAEGASGAPSSLK